MGMHRPATWQDGVVHRRFRLLCAGVAALGLLCAAVPASASSTVFRLDSSPALVGYLRSVSCVTDKWCMAVGQAGGANTPYHGVIEAGRGSTWSTLSGAPKMLGINSVSCTSTRFCMAVGDGANSTVGLRWTGKRWIATSVPHIKSPFLDQLSSVSCVSRSFCVAVGTYQQLAIEGTAGLIETWNGTSWTLDTAELSATSNKGYGLEGVSCTSATFCMAVGYERGGEQTVVEQWNGTDWSEDSVPSPASYFTLNAVSCTGVTSCVAVGSGYLASNSLAPLVVSFNGTIWKASTIPSGTYELSGVACLATGCTAVGGNYDTPQGYKDSTVVLAEHDGGSWGVISSPIYQPASFGSVACQPARCVAVGTFSPYDVGVPLVEVGT